MAWQDIRSWYEEQDDSPEGEPVELADCTCWWCGRTFVMPVDDPDRFCSLECGERWCAHSAGTVYVPPAGQGDDDIPF